MSKRNRNGKNKKKKFDIVSFILVLILVAGIGVIAYPTVSDYINSLNQGEAIATYVESVGNLTEDLYEQILADAQAYNTALAAKTDQWDFTEQDSILYESLLDPGGIGVMGIIEIPSISVSLPIYHGTSEGVLRIGVGHLEGTSLPVGGKGTHAVLSGHRGLTTAKLFTDLDKVEIGDYFYITVLNEKLAYVVDQILVVLPEDVTALAIDPDEDYVTLVTCTPYGINTHRLLVRGHRTELQEDGSTPAATGEATILQKIQRALIWAVPVLILLVILILLLTRRSKRKVRKLQEEAAEAERQAQDSESAEMTEAEILAELMESEDEVKHTDNAP